MSLTSTSTWSSVVRAAYSKDFLDTMIAKGIWIKLPNFRGDMNVVKGSTISFPVNRRLPRQVSNLTEGVDPSAITAAPTEVTVTIIERGFVVQRTKMLDATSYTDTHRMVSRQVAEGAVDSLDYYIRGQALSNSVVVYPYGCTSRADLDATDDLPQYEEVVQAVERASSLEVEPFDDGSFVTIVHPIGVAMLRKLTELTAVSEYSDPALLYTGTSALKGNERFPGEVFKINNLRVVSHPWGKVYLGAGTPAQSPTTTTAAIAVGATSFTVANATGIAVGDWLTIGTIESGATQQPTTEQVYVTSVNGTTIGIQGAGPNFGFKFAHDSGQPVTEAANVFAMPIFGRNSLVGYYDAEIGREGQLDHKEAPTAIPGRLWNYSWYWVGGVSMVDSNIVRAEFATTMGVHGAP